MKKTKILVVYSSHLSEEENQKFNNHVSKTIGVTHKIKRYENYNQYSLSEVYNDVLNKHSDEQEIVVFCHNDIEILTFNWGKRLLQHFNNSQYGIIGVAGTTYVGENGTWWTDRSKMYGIVEHTNGIQRWVSEYSNEIIGIQPVLHIDGLFMAVDPKKIINEFDENYGKFHFYDLTFSVSNYLSGVDIGVITNIRILHKSIGETDQSWEENRVKFVEEYKDELPIRLVQEEKLRVLICCQFFKNYTGSEMSNYELAKGLKKQGCDVTIVSTMVGEPLLSKATNDGIKVQHISHSPNYVIGKDNSLVFTKNESEFDVLHINHKPIGEMILKMYPNTPAVMHVRSEVIPVFEEPIIHPMIKKYISIRDSITDYIKGFGISGDDIVEIDNPFDTSRFNCDYKQIKNEKHVILFVGTLDHLRKNILLDLKSEVEGNNQELWIIGADNMGYSNELINGSVKYLGVKQNVEDYIKQCDCTAGIFKGRTTIEGFLCGKAGWIYKVDKEGNILSKEFTQVPDNLEKYNNGFSSAKVFNLYSDVINSTWFK
jgi:glycosyltransferase involved in cell wall biosynthesis